jgi:hypothetical protein
MVFSSSSSSSSPKMLTEKELKRVKELDRGIYQKITGMMVAIRGINKKKKKEESKEGKEWSGKM